MPQFPEGQEILSLGSGNVENSLRGGRDSYPHVGMQQLGGNAQSRHVMTAAARTRPIRGGNRNMMKAGQVTNPDGFPSVDKNAVKRLQNSFDPGKGELKMLGTRMQQSQTRTNSRALG